MILIVEELIDIKFRGRLRILLVFLLSYWQRTIEFYLQRSLEYIYYFYLIVRSVIPIALSYKRREHSKSSGRVETFQAFADYSERSATALKTWNMKKVKAWRSWNSSSSSMCSMCSMHYLGDSTGLGFWTCSILLMLFLSFWWSSSLEWFQWFQSLKNFGGTSGDQKIPNQTQTVSTPKHGRDLRISIGNDLYLTVPVASFEKCDHLKNWEINKAKKEEA